MSNFIFVLLLGLATSLFGGIVDDGLSHLSLHERACMKMFFDEAIKMDQASHVLFHENKPACLIAIVLKNKDKTFRNNQCLKGWRIFKKYEHFFPHPDFILDEKEVVFDEDFKVLHIYFINKYAHLCL